MLRTLLHLRYGENKNNRFGPRAIPHYRTHHPSVIVGRAADPDEAQEFGRFARSVTTFRGLRKRGVGGGGRAGVGRTRETIKPLRAETAGRLGDASGIFGQEG